MLTNREISRMFGLCSELLILHGQDTLLAGFLTGASYRIRRILDDLPGMDKSGLSKFFPPQITKLIEELKNTETLEELEELIS